MSRLSYILLSALSMLIFLCGPAIAQTSQNGATLYGVVTSQDGNPIANATVTVRDPTINFSWQGFSRVEGNYSVMEVPPGIYEIKVEAETFTPQVSRLVMELGTSKRADFKMSPFTPEVPLAKVQVITPIEGRTEGSTNLNSPFRFGNLPILRRNFASFALITPRVTPDRLPLGGGAISTSGLSFNAQPTRFNNVFVDGIENYDRNTGPLRSGFAQGSVLEFQVITDSYSAEFGNSLGGIITAVTRSGSNEFHGGIFSFISNDSVSARDAFALTNSFRDYQQYQNGFNVGGPIKKDRAFFLIGMSRASFKQENVIRIRPDINAAANRQGFLMSNGPVPFTIGVTAAAARIDVNLTPRNKFWLRYNGNFTYNSIFSPFGDFASNTAGSIQELGDNTIAVSNTYSNPAARLVNETRFSYGRRDQDVDPISDGPQIIVQDITPLNPGSNLLINDPTSLAIFGGNTTLPQPFQRRLRENSFRLLNNVSLARGRHQLKFGVSYAMTNNTAFVDVFARGQAIFLPLNNFGPGMPVITAVQALDPSQRTADQKAFLKTLAKQYRDTMPGFPLLQLEDLPLPVAFGQGFGPDTVDGQLQEVGAFIQDSYRLRPNLIIKAGLRYDHNRLRYAPRNNGNFSPRVAFSYSPAIFKDKLTVSAAYGIFVGPQLFGPSLAASIFGEQNRLVAVQPFPFSVAPYSMNSKHQFPVSNTLPADFPFIPQFSTTAIYDKNFRNSYAQQSRLNIDYSLDRNTRMSLTYVFVRGNRIYSARDINPVVRFVPNDELASQLFGRVDPTKGETIQSQSAYDSYYHGFTAQIDRRYANKFTLSAHYTLSKAIDNFVDFTAGIRDDAIQTDALEPNTGAERALSLQDVRNRFVASGHWDLNYTKNKLLTGFQLAGILTLESGRPYNLIRTTNVILSRGSITRPNFRPSGMGRNLGVTPGFASLDLRLTRTILVKDRYRIQPRVEVFNVFNRVNIRTVNGGLIPDANGNFGLPPKEGSRFTTTKQQQINAFPPRQLQFSLSIIF